MAYLFDGENRIIQLDVGTTVVAVKDIYLAWKDWATQVDNLKWTRAFTFVGGDPLVQGLTLGVTYFLENGWKIRPWDADHRLVVSGNLFSRDNSNPFAPTVNVRNVVISQVTSNLVEMRTIEGGNPVVPASDVAAAVWNHPVTPTANPSTMGGWVTRRLLTLKSLLAGLAVSK